MKRCIILMLFICVRLWSRSQENPDDVPLLMKKLAQSKEDTNRISLQIKLATYYYFKRGGSKNDKDTAILILNQAVQLSIQLHEPDLQCRALEITGRYYSYINDPERCKQSLMTIIDYCHQKGYKNKEADAWELLANLYDSKTNNHYLDRISYYEHARSLYLEIHQPKSANESLFAIALVRIAVKQYDVAETELLEVLNQNIVFGYNETTPVYSLLYKIEFAKGNYYRALAYCLKNIRTLEASSRPGNASWFYADAAQCNTAVKKYKEAVEWIQKAIATAEKSIDFHKCLLIENLLALNRIEEARIALNDLSGKTHSADFPDTLNQYKVTALYYDKINKNDLALLNYKKAFESSCKMNISEGSHNSWAVICNNGIAGIYLKANEAPKAANYLNNAALIFKNAKTPLDPEFLVEFYDHLYKYDVATGDYVAAVKNLEQRVTLQDSLFTSDKDKQLAELDIQYETTKKEQSIKELHTQGAGQQARLEKANLQRNITIGGILVMVLVSALFYRNYKQKQAANNIITHKNELLQHLLTEKEWLVKEIHHRVKNNLHTVMGLLGTQSGYLKNAEAITAIADSQHRIQAMSLIHQRLYQSNNLSSIKMRDYIHELVDFLGEIFNTGNRIRFNLEIEPIELDLAHCIPLGLILNEAITNSFKYAFPDNHEGVISISLTKSFENNFLLRIKDNGKGLPQGFNKKRADSMGINLMRGLSEEISAQFTISGENGTSIDIGFIYEPDTVNEIVRMQPERFS